MTTSSSWPRAASALGSAPMTSPRPPVLTKGAASEATNKSFTSHLRLAEEGGGFLRRRRIDGAAGTPLEAALQGKGGLGLQLPVIRRARLLAQRQRVQPEVAGRPLQGAVELAQRQAEHVCEPGELLRARGLDL